MSCWLPCWGTAHEGDPVSAAISSGPRLKAWLGPAVLLSLVLLLELCTRAGWVNAVLVPPPSAVALRVFTVVRAGSVIEPLGRTLYLLAVAYAIGCLLAIGVGVLMGRFRRVHGLLEPLVEVLRPLPKPALLPPLMLFLGLGDTMKITAVALGVFFPVLINTIQGVRGVDPVLVDVARTFQHSRAALLWKVVLPSAMPLVLAGMRIALGIALVLVVIAEMMAGTGGIGYLIIDLQRSFRVVDMYAWVVILAVLGYALNEVFVRIERRAIHWSGTRAG
ncbi:ABC transporter permease [uncultured Hydrogenophaga sp.]|uniref:ABC transporter permease n=1 Tax=uncultured Hydrogenophaga sp. TaxID=199683 RepID=UPI00258DAD6F|nr:ABC transporter permease [uncultured Hydrogenophaga sp.]